MTAVIFSGKIIDQRINKTVTEAEIQKTKGSKDLVDVFLSKT